MVVVIFLVVHLVSHQEPHKVKLQVYLTHLLEAEDTFQVIMTKLHNQNNLLKLLIL